MADQDEVHVRPRLDMAPIPPPAITAQTSAQAAHTARANIASAAGQIKAISNEYWLIGIIIVLITVILLLIVYIVKIRQDTTPRAETYERPQVKHRNAAEDDCAHSFEHEQRQNKLRELAAKPWQESAPASHEVVSLDARDERDEREEPTAPEESPCCAPIPSDAAQSTTQPAAQPTAQPTTQQSDDSAHIEDAPQISASPAKRKYQRR